MKLKSPQLRKFEVEAVQRNVDYTRNFSSPHTNMRTIFYMGDAKQNIHIALELDFTAVVRPTYGNPQYYTSPISVQHKRCTKALWYTQGANQFYLNEMPLAEQACCFFMDIDANVSSEIIDAIVDSISELVDSMLVVRRYKNNISGKWHLITNIITQNTLNRKALARWLRDKHFPECPIMETAFDGNKILEQEFYSAFDIGALGLRSLYSVKISNDSLGDNWYFDADLPSREDLSTDDIAEALWRGSIYNMTRPTYLTHEYAANVEEYRREVVRVKQQWELEMISKSEFNAQTKTIPYCGKPHVVNTTFVNDLIDRLDIKWKEGKLWHLLMRRLRHLVSIGFEGQYFLHEWSRESPSYSEEGNNRLWQGAVCKPELAGGVLTWLRDEATRIVSLAERFGGVRIPPVMDQECKLEYSDYSKIVTKDDALHYLYSCFAFIDNGGRSFWLTKNFEDDVIKYSHIEAQSKHTGNFKSLIMPYDPKVNVLMLLQQYRLDITYKCVQFIPQLEYAPIEKTFNLFGGFRHKTGPFDEAVIQPVLRHIKEVWANDSNEVFGYLINWFAHMIQRPSQRMDTALVMTSRQGAGKNIILEWIGKSVIGKRYYTCVERLEEFWSRFNGQFEGKLFTICEETRTHELHSDKLVESLNSLITRSEIKIEHKGGEIYTVNDFNNYVFLSNRDTPLPIVHDDRRFFIVECNNKYAGRTATDIAYFKGLKALLDDPATGMHMFRRLAARDINDWDPRFRPVTVAKMKMKIDSAPSPVRMLVEYCRGEFVHQNLRALDGVLLFSIEALYDAYRGWCEQSGVKLVCNKLSFSKVINSIIETKQVKVQGRNIRGWRTSMAALRESLRLHFREPDLQLGEEINIVEEKDGDVLAI